MCTISKVANYWIIDIIFWQICIKTYQITDYVRCVYNTKYAMRNVYLAPKKKLGRYITYLCTTYTIIIFLGLHACYKVYLVDWKFTCIVKRKNHKGYVPYFYNILAFFEMLIQQALRVFLGTLVFRNSLMLYIDDLIW